MLKFKLNKFSINKNNLFSRSLTFLKRSLKSITIIFVFMHPHFAPLILWSIWKHNNNYYCYYQRNREKTIATYSSTLLLVSCGGMFNSFCNAPIMYAKFVGKKCPYLLNMHSVIYVATLLFDVFLSTLHVSGALAFRRPNEFNSFNDFTSPVTESVGTLISFSLSTISCSLYDTQLTAGKLSLIS